MQFNKAKSFEDMIRICNSTLLFVTIIVTLFQINFYHKFPTNVIENSIKDIFKQFSGVIRFQMNNMTYLPIIDELICKF